MISTIKEWWYRINHYPNIIKEFAIIDQERDELCNRLDELVQRNQELSIKLGNLTRKVDVNDKDFWNSKWVKSKIFYKAPNRRWVTQYVKEYDFPSIKNIAREIVNAYSLSIDDLDGVPLAVMKWVKSNKFKYAKEPSELWKCPEQILDDRDKGNDCDDIGILMYYVLRQIFKELNCWHHVKHRLKCICGNVNHRGSIPFGLGGHFYLTWLHSDGHWYTQEPTFYLDNAIKNWGKLPQKYNPQYGTIWFSFNDEHSWAQKSITVTKKSFIKDKENV